jgi:hypothetical protein
MVDVRYQKPPTMGDSPKDFWRKRFADIFKRCHMRPPEGVLEDMPGVKGETAGGKHTKCIKIFLLSPLKTGSFETFLNAPCVTLSSLQNTLVMEKALRVFVFLHVGHFSG